MKAILRGTTLKISSETEQEGKDLKVWLKKNIGREGDMEFSVSPNKLICGDCKQVTTNNLNEVFCGMMGYFEDRGITDLNSRLNNCPLTDWRSEIQ